MYIMPVKMMIQTFCFNFPIMMTSVGRVGTTPPKEAERCYLCYLNMILCLCEKIPLKASKNILR